MTQREKLNILRRVVQKAIDHGFASEPGWTILGVDFVLDSASIVIRRQSPSVFGDHNLYLDSLFPLWHREWAIAFWGRGWTDLRGYNDVAWRNHQHRLLDFLQHDEQDEFYQYLELFL